MDGQHHLPLLFEPTLPRLSTLSPTSNPTALNHMVDAPGIHRVTIVSTALCMYSSVRQSQPLPPHRQKTRSLHLVKARHLHPGRPKASRSVGQSRGVVCHLALFYVTSCLSLKTKCVTASFFPPRLDPAVEVPETLRVLYPSPSGDCVRRDPRPLAQDQARHSVFRPSRLDPAVGVLETSRAISVA